MATGRIRRSARRGISVAVLGWLGVAAFSVLAAPSAGAAPTATVPIRDLTVPLVSVDKGGSVTFVNEIQDKKLQVGVGPLSVVDATVHTDVALRLPSGEKRLQRGQSAAETFNGPCGCSVTFTYRVDGALLNQVAGQLPPLPAPTPFVVNTIVPNLPNVPGVNLPQLPQVNVPLPVPNGEVPPPPAPPMPPGSPAPTTPPGGTPPAGEPTREGIPGTQYTYTTGSEAPQLSPADIVAASAFDPSRYYVPGRSLGGADRGRSGTGSGGVPGNYDGASVPVFGQLAGLDGTGLDEEGVDEAAAANRTAAAQALPAAALAAVVALAAVTAALVRTHQAARASR
jgi:hypothetical protein